MTNLSRTSYASRTTLQRRLQNAAFAAKKKDAKTLTNSLNDFRKSNAIFNYRLCILCDQFFLNSSAYEISNNDPLYDQHDLGNQLGKRRQYKHWICTVCKSAAKPDEELLSSPILKIIEIDGKKIIYPSQNDVSENLQITMDTLVMTPVVFPGTFTLAKGLSIKIFNNQHPTNEFISSLYKRRLSKFSQRKLASELYDGVIHAPQQNKLNSISRIYDDTMIRKSRSWKSRRRDSIYNQFHQFGQTAIAFNIDISFDNLQTLVTSLLCEGSVITLEFEGNTSDEHQTKYFQHNHNHQVECGNTCVVTEITEVNQSLHPKFIPIYICCVSQKHSSLIENFIKNKNFPFHAEEYFSGVDFYLDGNAKLSGVMWSYECNIFNEELSTASLNGQDLEMYDYLQYIENSILTTVNTIRLKEVLGVSDEEAVKIHNLARKHQVNLDMDPTWVSLPSFQTLFKMKPKIDSKSNIDSSKTLLLVMKNKLLSLTEEEKNSLTTEEWLESIGKNVTFDVTTESIVYIQLEDKWISFIVDDNLTSFVTKYDYFTGIYHYSLSCDNEQYSIVMKRLHILDCFTTTYEINLLKAFSERIEIIPIHGVNNWWNFEDKYEELLPDLENSEVAHLIQSHSLVTLPELYALSDPTKIRDISSVQPEFIAPFEHLKPKFKKVRVPSEHTYEMPGIGFFEKLSNNIARHFSRLNGRDLLLVETCLNYDLLPKKTGLEIFSLYKDDLKKIPNGERSSVYGEIFPTYILCSNLQVIKLRKRMKVMHLPHLTSLSKEEKYARILLFYPILPGQSIDSDRVGK